MKNPHEKFLKECIGDTGYEALNKAIMRQGMDAPTDLKNTYTSLLVVPRALLAWVATCLRPMADGGMLQLDIPGGNGARMNVNKFKNDIYSGEVYRDGKVLHQFKEATIPLIAGHLMTVLELYDDFEEKPQNSEAIVNGLVPLIEQMVSEHMKATQPTVNLTINNISQPKEEPKPVLPPTLPVIKEELKPSSSFAVGYHMALGNYHRGKGDNEKALDHDKRMDSHIKKVGGQFAKINKEEFDAGAAKAMQNIQKDEWGDEDGIDQGVDEKQNVYEEEHEKLVDEKEKEDAEEAKDKEQSGEESEDLEKKTAQDYISGTISDLMHDKGYPQKRAIAAAYNIAREKGYKVSKEEVGAIAKTVMAMDKTEKVTAIMTKDEMQSVCPDCGDPEFVDGKFMGCMCMYEMRKANLKIVKNEKGHYTLEFGKGWDEENIQLLLDMLRRKD